MNSFDRQKELELMSVERGVKRYMEAVNADKESGREFDAPVGQRVVSLMLGRMVPAVRSLQKEARKKLRAAQTVGSRLMGWEIPIEASDPERLAYITVRTILNAPRIGTTGRKATIASHIGRMANLEFRWEELRAGERERAKDSPPNRIQMMKREVKRINPRSLRKWLRVMDDIHTSEWDYETRMKVGLVLLDMAVEHCQEFVEITMRTETNNRRVYRIVDVKLKDDVRAAMEEEYGHRAESAPWFLPMVCPPRPWTWDGEKFTGGYLSHDVPLIKSLRWRHTAAVSGGETVSPTVLQALRAINETAWAINTKVLEVARGAVDARAKEVLPVAPLEPLPEEITPEAWAKMTRQQRGIIKSERRVIHDRNNRLQAKREAMGRKLEVADSFRDEAAIYFPHNLDFRGRSYPISQDLHPQGDDFARGLLKFSRALPLGTSGVRWLSYRVAATYGMDKLTRADQIDWCVDHLADLHTVAVDPLGAGYAFWSQAEEPWQFLAAALELDSAFQHPKGPEWFASSLPVYVDGSCNGLQHLSAMGLDPVGARATNLMGGEERQDIYQIVADKVKESALRDACGPDQEKADLARNWLGNINRKVVKRGVMTVPYGLTDIGMRDQLIEDRWTDDIPGDTMKNATYLRDLMKYAISDTVIKATEIMGWMQDNATILAHHGKPVDWTTPSGFKVRQAYFERPMKTIRTLMGVTQIWLDNQGEHLKSRKQALSIAPNIIHSFDAAHMMLTIESAAQSGMSDFAVIHDSFGCHACHMDDFLKIVRQEFVNIYKQDWFASLQAEFQATAGPDTPLIPPPSRGEFDIERVNQAEFFFA